MRMFPELMLHRAYMRLVSVKAGYVLLALIAVCALVLIRFAEFDVWVAAQFGDQNGFPATQDSTLRALRRTSINFTTFLAVALVVLLIFRLIRPARNDTFSFAKLAFPLTALIAGPGLLTNLLFKENWGRPRPRHLEEFGGDATHVAPFEISDQCVSNCSFVSGETSSAIWLVTLIPLLPLVFHSVALLFVGFYVVLISYMRIAFGGHFFSDVVFSILLNGLVFWTLWGVFFERFGAFQAKAWCNETRAHGFLTRLGRPLRPIDQFIIGPLLLAYSNVMDKVRAFTTPSKGSP